MKSFLILFTVCLSAVVAVPLLKVPFVREQVLGVNWESAKEIALKTQNEIAASLKYVKEYAQDEPGLDQEVVAAFVVIIDEAASTGETNVVELLAEVEAQTLTAETARVYMQGFHSLSESTIKQVTPLVEQFGYPTDFTILNSLGRLSRYLLEFGAELESILLVDWVLVSEKVSEIETLVISALELVPALVNEENEEVGASVEAIVKPAVRDVENLRYWIDLDIERHELTVAKAKEDYYYKYGGILGATNFELASLFAELSETTTTAIVKVFTELPYKTQIVADELYVLLEFVIPSSYP